MQTEKKRNHPGVRVRVQKDGTKRYQARFTRPHPSFPRKRIVTVETFATPTEAKNWLADQRVRYNPQPQPQSHARQAGVLNAR